MRTIPPGVIGSFHKAARKTRFRKPVSGVSAQELLRKDGSVQPGLSITLRDIRPKQFTGIGKGFGSGPCDCCGYKWVHNLLLG